MLKNKLLPIIILILLVLGAGVFVITKGRGQKTGGSTPGTNTSSGGNNVFSSIRDAINRAITLKCEYTDPETGKKTLAYIKGEMVRADTTTGNDNEPGSFLYKNNFLYMWNSKTKEGIQWDLTVPTSAQKTTLPDDSVQKPESKDEMIADLEEQKQSCKPDNVPATLFDPPTDVKFTDFAKMFSATGMPNEEQLQQIQQQMEKQFGEQPPTANEQE